MEAGWKVQGQEYWCRILFRKSVYVQCFCMCSLCEKFWSRCNGDKSCCSDPDNTGHTKAHESDRWEGVRGTPRRFVHFAPSHIRGRLNRVILLHKVRSYSCQLEFFRNRSWRAWSHSPWLYTFGKDFLQSVWTVKETRNLWRMWMSPQPGQAARNLDLQLLARPTQYWAASKNSARIQLFLLNACPVKYERQLFLVLNISCTVWRELTATFANRSFVACTLITLRTIQSLATLHATMNLWTPMR